jgi:hypothetical protein
MVQRLKTQLRHKDWDQLSTSIQGSPKGGWNMTSSSRRLEFSVYSLKARAMNRLKPRQIVGEIRRRLECK